MSKRAKPDFYKSQVVQIENQYTGEFEEHKLEVMASKVGKPKVTASYTMLMQGVTTIMSQNMSPVACKLLLWLMSNAEYKNVITSPSVDWAEKLKCSKRNIERAIKELLDLGILFKERHPHDRRISIFTINPLQSWKGSELERRKKIKEHENPNQLDLFKNLPDDFEEKNEYTFVGDSYHRKKKNVGKESRAALDKNKGE